MQILEVLRHDAPRAIATDWKQFRCALRGHGGIYGTGTTYGPATPVPGNPKLWNIGNARERYYRCKTCDKSIVIKLYSPKSWSAKVAATIRSFLSRQTGLSRKLEGMRKH